MRLFYRFLIWTTELERAAAVNPAERARLSMELDRWECALMREELGLTGR